MLSLHPTLKQQLSTRTLCKGNRIVRSEERLGYRLDRNEIAVWFPFQPWLWSLVGAVAKLRNVTVSFIMSVSTSVRPLVCMEQLCSHRPDFHEILYWNIFRKYVQKIQVSLKSDKNNGHFTWRPINIFFYHISFNSSYSEKYFRQICTENQSTSFMFNNFSLSRKSCHLWDNVEQCCRAGQATDDKRAHAHCVLEHPSLQTHTRNMQYLLLFHCNNGCKNAPHCYAIVLRLSCSSP